MLSTTIYIWIKAQKKKKARNSCSSSAFSWLTMHYNHIFRILKQPFRHLVYKMQHQMKRWSMMILPIEICYPPIKSLVIILGFTYIKNKIFVFMILFKKLFYLYRKFIFNVFKIIVLINCSVNFNIVLEDKN
jgi:hypothetical protein